jgi:hypothetical protein
MAKLLLTERGGQKLILNGFGYTKHREMEQGIRWRCEKKQLKCNAYAITAADIVDGGEVKEFGQHIHGLNAAKFEISHAKNLLKRKAGESVASTSIIVSEVVRQTSDFAAADLPKISSMKRNVRNYRSSDVGPGNRSNHISIDRSRRGESNKKRNRCGLLPVKSYGPSKFAC